MKIVFTEFPIEKLSSSSSSFCTFFCNNLASFFKLISNFLTRVLNKNEPNDNQCEPDESHWIRSDQEKQEGTIDGACPEEEEVTVECKELDETESSELQNEHDDPIQQLKRKLKKVKTGGLSTILEDFETPKMAEDIKPMNISPRMEYKDQIAEIRAFHDIYTKKMKRLDITNDQTLHAIEFLQLRDQMHGNRSSPFVKSLFSNKLKQRKKMVIEMQKELETVYVAQICHSWEILLWQYNKARELQQLSSSGIHRYNHAAVEFQQFQALIQRFLEREPVRSLRFRHYVEEKRNRRDLLHVPVINEDFAKDNKRTVDRDEIWISIGMLLDQIEHSIRVFWQFLHAEKDETGATFKFPQRSRIRLHDDEDLDLINDLRSNWQKQKEKKLKRSVRFGNFLVRKIRKIHERRPDTKLLVAQVEIKLISRVLNAPRLTTKQLVWCSEKLSRTSVVDEKIDTTHSLRLFPFP